MRQQVYSSPKKLLRGNVALRSGGQTRLAFPNALKLKYHIGEYYAIEKHMHRIKHIPENGQYDIRDSIRHYLHQSDKRDAEVFPNYLSSYTPEEERSPSYKIDTLLHSTHRPGIEIVIDHLYRNRDVFYKVPASINYYNSTHGASSNTQWTFSMKQR